eukprot:scaffold2462_cov402-Prasinococcus_capsulatus_cf.AAC.1
MKGLGGAAAEGEGGCWRSVLKQPPRAPARARREPVDPPPAYMLVPTGTCSPHRRLAPASGSATYSTQQDGTGLEDGRPVPG